jgi:cytochrome P450
MLYAAALGEHELPRGTEVLLSIYETHRDADVYRDPQAFRPQRWETIQPSVYEYNPFSTGPRTCIGAAFALMEIKVVLSMVLSRFRLALMPQPIDRFAELVLTPKHGLKMRVCAADGNHRESRARVTGNVLEMVDLP